MIEKNKLNPQDPLNQIGGHEILEMQNEISKVVTNPKQSLIILIVAFIICLVIFLKLFFNNHTVSTNTTPLSLQV